MIPAYVARRISSEHETNIMKSATEKQLKEIGKAIEKATNSGLYSIFREHELYPSVEQELCDNGYKINKCYSSKEEVKVFNGITISW